MSVSSLTLKEIFDRLGELQKQLDDNGAMGKALCAALEAADIPNDVGEDVRAEIVSNICEPFNTREVSLQRLIEVYEKMLDKLA